MIINVHAHIYRKIIVIFDVTMEASSNILTMTKEFLAKPSLFLNSVIIYFFYYVVMSQDKQMYI